MGITRILNWLGWGIMAVAIVLSLMGWILTPSQVKPSRSNYVNPNSKDLIVTSSTNMAGSVNVSNALVESPLKVIMSVMVDMAMCGGIGVEVEKTVKKESNAAPESSPNAAPETSPNNSSGGNNGNNTEE